MLAKRFIAIAVAGFLLIGIKAWSEEVPKLTNEHVVNVLTEKFRTDLEVIKKGLTDGKLADNFSTEAMLLRRSLLILENTAKPDAEVKTLAEFADLEKAIREFVKKEPKLEKLKDKKTFTVADIDKIEKALLEVKGDSQKELMARLSVVLDVETEKTLNSALSTDQALENLAQRKMLDLPKDTPILSGEGTPLTRKINDALKAQLKEDKVERAPNLGDLVTALKKDTLKLTPAELLALNETLAPMQVKENGGISTNETLRQLYRGFANKLPLVDRDGVPGKQNLPGKLEDFFDRFEATTPSRPAGPSTQLERLRPLQPFREPGTVRGGGRSGNILQNSDGRPQTITLTPQESNLADLLNGRKLTGDEKSCLAKANAENYETRMTFASKPGSLTHCSSEPTAVDPADARVNPRKSTQKGLEGMCEADFMMAKHCLEPGDVESISIRGVNEPITHAQVLVEFTSPSVTGGDDIGVLRVAMSCEAAKNLKYQKVATPGEAADALKDQAALLIARNRDINVEKGGSPFLFARAYQPGGENRFSAFAVTDDVENRGQRVVQGDSGGPQIACVGGEPKVIGATSTVLITNPGQRGGKLGRAASLASLEFVGKANRHDVTIKLDPLAQPRYLTKTGADKAVHPSL